MTTTPETTATLMPGLDLVGRGVYLRPNQPYELKDVIFERQGGEPFYSKESDTTYWVPAGYCVNDSPPMPSSQALNLSLVEESWERFEKRTSLDTSAAVSNGPFSVDVNLNESRQLRQEEDSYYAMRSSFIPMWTIYIPSRYGRLEQGLDVDIPTPFSHAHRQKYAQVFDRYGSHYIRRVWVGGKASLVFTIRKSTLMTKEEIHAGLKASMTGVGGGSVSTESEASKESLRSNSQVTVLGKGGNEFKLAALSSLDEAQYNDWLATVKDNPQVIEFEAIGIWTLVTDPAKAQALMEAYREETVFSPLRAIFNLDERVHIFEDTLYYTFDIFEHATSAPERIEKAWPDLKKVGFERVDAAFLGKYLVSQENEDLSRKVFFFNRDKYLRWDVDRNSTDPGYPRLISEGWPGVTFDRIDAAVNIAPDALYFFKGSEYVRFNMLTNRADEGYPDLVSKRWVGVTFDRIDAAVYWGNGIVYFFRNDQYIRYDTVLWRAEAGYPKSIGSNYVQDWRFFE
jgi:hypothetical protein